MDTKEDAINMINIKKLLNEALGPDIKVEVEAIKVPEGSTVEEVMIERGYKPMGERCSCGDHHVFTSPNGDSTIALDDHPKTERPFSEIQASAVATVRKKQAAAELMADLLGELAESIAQPKDGRTGLDLINEIALMQRVRQIAGDI